LANDDARELLKNKRVERLAFTAVGFKTFHGSPRSAKDSEEKMIDDVAMEEEDRWHVAVESKGEFGQSVPNARRVCSIP